MFYYIFKWWWVCIPIAVNIFAHSPSGEVGVTPAWVVHALLSVGFGGAAAICFERAGSALSWATRVPLGVLGVCCTFFNLFNALESVSKMAQDRGDPTRVLIETRTRLQDRDRVLAREAEGLIRQSHNDPSEAIEAHIFKLKAHRLYQRSSQCSDVSQEDSEAHCGQLANAKMQLAAAKKLDRIKTERGKIWSRLTSIESAPRTSEPGLTALANATSYEIDQIRTFRDIMIAILIELFNLMPMVVSIGRKRRVPAPPPERPAVVPDLVGQWASERLRPDGGSELNGKPIQDDFLKWCRTHGHQIPKAWQSTLAKGMVAMGYRRSENPRVTYHGVAFASTQLKIVKT